MGIGPSALLALAETAESAPFPGRSVMLGRQRMRAADRKRRHPLFGAPALRRLANRGIDPRKLTQDDGYSERMFRELGIGDIETLDFSAFEGATLLWDLNEAVPEDWHGQFGFVFDGGTIEHVLNVPAAMANVHRMLAPGGRFLAVSPLSGWVGHGFYQFNPELVYAIWKRMFGCNVLRCYATDDRANFRLDFPDVEAQGGTRREWRTTWHGLGKSLPPRRLYLVYEVERTGESVSAQPALQSDYVHRWDVSGAADAQVKQ